MKVLIVHHQMKLYGGAELVVVRLAHYLQEHGHTVRILAASTSRHEEYEGLDIVTPPKQISWHLWDGAVSSLIEIGQVFWALYKLCREHADDYDVVNPHNFPAVWTVPHYKRIVWMCNEVPDLWHRDHANIATHLLKPGKLLDRHIMYHKSPTAIVADSTVAETFYARYRIKPRIIPYGIDGGFFAQPVNVERQNFTIIQPSMISPSKNQMALLKAMKQLRPIISDIKVIFAGYKEQTPYLKQLEQYVAEHNLNAVFTGQLHREELRVLYNKAYIAVFPGEGQGSWLGPFESLAASCPVIISPNLSCAGTIDSLGTVSDNLVQSIQNIHSNYLSAKAQALEGRKFVLNNLTWDKFGARFLEVLEGASK